MQKLYIETEILLQRFKIDFILAPSRYLGIAPLNLRSYSLHLHITLSSPWIFERSTIITNNDRLCVNNDVVTVYKYCSGLDSDLPDLLESVIEGCVETNCILEESWDSQGITLTIYSNWAWSLGPSVNYVIFNFICILIYTYLCK